MGERVRIGLREIRALGLNSEIWDTEATGFGARRQTSDTIAYFVMYWTNDGRRRRVTIGRHGKYTPDTARSEARRIIGAVAGGADPAAKKTEARHASTVAELCDDYLADAETGRLLTKRRVAKKASTLATDRGRIEQHIKPLLGKVAVGAVTREKIEAFMHSVAEGKTAKREKSGKVHGLTLVTGGKGTASRTVGAARRNLHLCRPEAFTLRQPRPGRHSLC